ncbi:hypothetical protein OG430_41935 [Streptomyces sp. NBC_01304]|nr:hypothetical protein OG430_41935 [Streptomyces sp. NBC_01304]
MDERQERLERLASSELASALVGPADRDRAVDGHPGLVDGQALEGGTAQRGLEGGETSNAVAEHEAGAGGRADGFDVRAFDGRAVGIPLRTAGSAPAALDDVHREPVGQHGGEHVEVRRQYQHAGHHHEPWPGSHTAVADAGAVGGEHLPDRDVPFHDTGNHAVPCSNDQQKSEQCTPPAQTE